MKISNVNYNKPGFRYSGHRKTDPQIAKYILRALGSAKTVLNVGAGAGSYEPNDRYVIAVEPSSGMRSHRLKLGKSPAVNAAADSLPFDDNSFDASTAFLTVHHWSDLKKGLNELKRVTRNQIIIMTFDPDALYDFWNAEYFPELIEIEKRRYPKISKIVKLLGKNIKVISIPIPFDCKDGFQEAFFGRPEMFLKKEVRDSQSAWSFLSKNLEKNYVKKLSDDVKSGEWDKKFGKYRSKKSFRGALRLIVLKKEKIRNFKK